MNNKENELCDLPHFHNESIESALNIMPIEEDIISLGDMFKVLADATRLKIILALMENELCVCDICHVVGISQSAASHQLRVLRGTHLAKYRKIGKMVYYSIDDDHVSEILKQALEHIHHEH